MAKLKKWIVKQALTVLSLAPIASVAFAASSKLSEADLRGPLDFNPDSTSRLGSNSGFTAQDLSDPILKTARRSLFRAGEMRKTHAEAYAYFREQTGFLDEAEANEEFFRAIQILRQKKLIVMDEKEIISSIPSNGIFGG
jgi:hypothetical protein